MPTDKYYVIKDNVVTNIIVADDEYASRHNLIRHPVITQFGAAGIDWTFIDNTFLPPPRDVIKEWEEVREQRNQLLVMSDVFVAPDRWQTYTNEQQQALSYYRQKLRDLPQDFVDPQEVVYPQRPNIK